MMFQDTRVCYVRADSGDDLILRVLPGFPRVTGSSQDDLMLLNFGNAHTDWEDYQANLTNLAHYVRQDPCQYCCPQLSFNWGNKKSNIYSAVGDTPNLVRSVAALWLMTGK